MSETRYFIDERCGCIAIRDRENTDPEYQGLHENTTGVVWFRMGYRQRKVCSECGYESGVWAIRPEDQAEALLECARLNALAREATNA